MEYAVLAFCAVAVALGLFAIVAPATFGELLGVLQTPSGLWSACVSRLAMGAAFYLAASASTAPGVLRALGILFVAAGLLVPVMGQQGLARTVEWFLSGGPWLTRAWGIVAILFGLAVGNTFRA